VSDFRSTTYADRDRARAYDAVDDVRAPGWEDAAAFPAAVVPPDAPLAAEVADGNLRRYARWQWRDFWQRRGFWMTGAALFGVWLLVHWALSGRLEAASNGSLQMVPIPPEGALAISHVAFAIGGVLAGLLGVGGLVARERERGLQRFLFAKPVNIVRYYLQGLAVNTVGSMLVLGGAVLLAAFTAPQALSVATLLAVGAAGYVLGGGATFLVSTLLRFDAPLAGAWLLAGFPVVALAENGFRWAQALQWLFPHGPALAVAKAAIPMGPSTPPDIALVFFVIAAVAAVWGALCTAAGVVVLRRRAISA
jgi:hypothetical protein